MRNNTSADIMTVFSLTTMRYFLPTDLTPYPHTLKYLRRIGDREAYRRASRKVIRRWRCS
jgi:glutathione S-transferase